MYKTNHETLLSNKYLIGPFLIEYDGVNELEVRFCRGRYNIFPNDTATVAIERMPHRFNGNAQMSVRWGSVWVCAVRVCVCVWVWAEIMPTSLYP